MPSARPHASAPLPVGTLEKTLKRKHIHVPPLGGACGGCRVLPGSLAEKVTEGELSDKELFFLSELSGFALLQGARKAKYFKAYSRDWLYAVLTKSYRRVVERLLEMELIEVALNSEGKESYSTLHHRSKQYRLNPLLTEELLEGNLFYHQLKDKKILQRLLKWTEGGRKRLYERMPWLKEEVSHMEGLKFMEKEATAFVREVHERMEFRGEPLSSSKSHSLLHHLRQLSKMFEGERAFGTIKVGENSGRLTHPLALCQRELRRFVVTKDGQKMVEVDLKAAQWVFLAKAMGQAHLNGVSRDLKKRLEPHILESIDLKDIHQGGGLLSGQLAAFIRAVMTMDIYSELGWLKESSSYVKVSGEQLAQKERREVKRESLADLLFDYHRKTDTAALHDSSESTLVAALARNYPMVLDFIKQFTQECSNRNRPSQDLSIFLQRSEAYFFHQRLREGLKKSFGKMPYFIVHDAVYVPENKSVEVQELCERALKKYLGFEGRWERG